MSKIIFLLLLFFLSGCDDLINNKNSDAIPILGDVNASTKDGDVPFKEIVDINNSNYIPIVAPKKDTDDQKCTTNITQNELIGSVDVLNNSNDLSRSLLVNSQKMLVLSKSISESGIFTQEAYVKAMLQLSEDILEMADKIGEMSDRILIMADKIGDMSERILETQRIQSANVALTQKNIIEAQKNFNKILQE